MSVIGACSLSSTPLLEQQSRQDHAAGAAGMWVSQRLRIRSLARAHTQAAASAVAALPALGLVRAHHSQVVPQQRARAGPGESERAAPSAHHA